VCDVGLTVFFLIQTNLHQRDAEVESILGQACDVTLDDDMSNIRKCIQTLQDYFNLEWKDYPHSFVKDQVTLQIFNTWSSLRYPIYVVSV